jgi:hypothetical protein
MSAIDFHNDSSLNCNYTTQEHSMSTCKHLQCTFVLVFLSCWKVNWSPRLWWKAYCTRYSLPVLSAILFLFVLAPFISHISWYPIAILSHRCNSPTGLGEAKVESCVLWNMTSHSFIFGCVERVFAISSCKTVTLTFSLSYISLLALRWAGWKYLRCVLKMIQSDNFRQC